MVTIEQPQPKRRMGRPAKDAVREDNIRVTIRITPEDRRRMRALIETDGAMGDFAREAIRERCERLERRAAKT